MALYYNYERGRVNRKDKEKTQRFRIVTDGTCRKGWHETAIYWCAGTRGKDSYNKDASEDM